MTDTHTATNVETETAQEAPVVLAPHEARAGDEFYLAGAWWRAKSVQHLAGGRIVVRWASGGSMAGAAKNLAGRVRRPVSK